MFIDDESIWMNKFESLCQSYICLSIVLISHVSTLVTYNCIGPGSYTVSKIKFISWKNSSYFLDTSTFGTMKMHSETIDYLICNWTRVVANSRPVRGTGDMNSVILLSGIETSIWIKHTCIGSCILDHSWCEREIYIIKLRLSVKTFYKIYEKYINISANGR